MTGSSMTGARADEDELDELDEEAATCGCGASSDMRAPQRKQGRKASSAAFISAARRAANSTSVATKGLEEEEEEEEEEEDEDDEEEIGAFERGGGALELEPSTITSISLSTSTSSTRALFAGPPAADAKTASSSATGKATSLTEVELALRRDEAAAASACVQRRASASLREFVPSAAAALTVSCTLASTRLSFSRRTRSVEGDAAGAGVGAGAGAAEPEKGESFAEEEAALRTLPAAPARATQQRFACASGTAMGLPADVSAATAAEASAMARSTRARAAFEGMLRWRMDVSRIRIRARPGFREEMTPL